VARSGLRLGCAVVALAIATPALGQDIEAPPRVEVEQELATTYRVLADEQFLAEDRESALLSYRSAARIAETLGGPNDLESELLRSELAYRQLLLERGDSFWGSRLSARPINPVTAYVDLLSAQKDLSGQIAAVYAIDQSAPQVPPEYQIGQAMDEENVQVGELVKLAALTRVRDVERRREILDARLVAITEDQRRIAALRGPLLESMDHVDDALNAALISAAAQYAGIPAIEPEALGDAARGEATSLLTSAALAYAAGHAPAELSSALGEFSETAKTAVELYRDVRATADQVETGLRLINAARDGDTAAMVAAGGYLFDQLSPETQADLVSQIGGERNIRAVIGLAQSGTALRRELSSFLAAAPELGAAAQSAIFAFVDPAADGFETNIAALALRLFDPGRGLAEQAEGLAQLGRGWATSFVAEAIGDDKAQAVAQALGANCNAFQQCRDWLHAKARAGTLLGNPAIELDRGGLLTVTAGDGTIIVQTYMADVAARIAGRPLEGISSSGVRAALDTAFATSLGPRLRAAAIDALPGERFDANFAALLADNAGLAGRAIAAVSAPAGEGGGLLDRTLAGAMLGRDLADRTLASNAASAPAGSGDQVAELAVRQALAAMGPYGVAANIALTAFQSMGQLSDIAKQLDDLAKEDRKLMEERMHLTTLAQKLDTDQALAKLEEQIASLRVDGAGRRMERYRESLRSVGELNNWHRRRIRDSLPLTYYFSERVRQNLAMLDQSLGFWAGRTGLSRNIIDAAVRSDPNSARLALDPQIRLFDWLGGSTAQRTDLSRLDEQWKRNVALATQACTDLNCRSDLAVMGSVRASGEIALSGLTKKLAPKPCAPGALRRCAEFLLEPSNIPELGSPDGLRLVTITARLATPTEPDGFPAHIDIAHSGLGFMREAGRAQREQLEASRPLAPKYVARDAASLSNALTDLEGRWRTARTLGEVEGYPLFGLYRVILPPSFHAATSELWLTFFYQVPNAKLDEQRTPPAVELECLSPTGASHVFAPADLPLLVGTDDSNRLVDASGGSDFAGCRIRDASE
jgi:hypothetical protein